MCSPLPRRSLVPPHQLRNISKSDHELVETLRERAQSSRKLHDKIHNLFATEPVTTDKVAWGHWMTSTFPEIHQSSWDQYIRQSFDSLMRYVAESKRIRQQEQAPKQQQQQFQTPVFQPPQQYQTPQLPQQYQTPQQYQPSQAAQSQGSFS
jgi:hypothetical protein